MLNIYSQIQELRAELVRCFLTRRERAQGEAELKKTGMNNDFTISTLIEFIAAIPAAGPKRPRDVMTKIEKAK